MGDEEARDYVANYSSEALAAFDRLPAPHRFDLWRYIVLYKEGGIYLDIKSMPALPLVDLFGLDREWEKPTLITVLGTRFEPHRHIQQIFNGVLAATPRLPLFRRLIEH